MPEHRFGFNAVQSIGGHVSDHLIEDMLAQIDYHMRGVVDRAERDADGVFGPNDLPVYDVIRYHLGWVDEHFRPATTNPGKRIRPVFCLLSTTAAGGNPSNALPVAAGIELLHNFTLMHDDIQDRSELRRGRETVWQHWGEAQAINAGDATFALSQLAVFDAAIAGLDANTVADLAVEFNRMTLKIVEGQVLDLGFEKRMDVQPDEYLTMISGKTAAIVSFASWAGARIAGCDDSTADRWAELGRLLGLGFQIRDDYLGIWGDAADTGKQPGDDIRGRKQSIPIIMMLDAMNDNERGELLDVYRKDTVSEDDVAGVTSMLDQYGVAERVQQMTEEYHQRGLAMLDEIAQPGEAKETLGALAGQLVDRSR